MLCFRDHHWLLVPGASRFSVRIQPQNICTRDLDWSLAMHYTAGGAAWRRVQPWHRPRIVIEVSNFQPHVQRWTELAGVSFWEMVPYDMDHDSGSFDVEYAPAEGTGPSSTTSWAKRSGASADATAAG